MAHSPLSILRIVLALPLLLAQAVAPAQTAPAPAQAITTPPASGAPPAAASADTGAPPASNPVTATPPAPAQSLAALDWLQGCWRGAVNQREFREQWLPPGGGMMIGAGHTVMQGHTQDYEYLRLEARADGLYYVAVPSGQKETSFRLNGVTHDEVSGADIWTFNSVAEGFPQRIVYRRGGEGWLYAGVEGTLNGEERKVLYPMRHVNCETGEVLHK